MMKERSSNAASGGLMLFVLLLAMIGSIVLFAQGLGGRNPLLIVAAVLVFISTLVMLNGLTVVDPNTGVVNIFFGSYAGSIRKPGFWYVNPFNVKKRISLRVRNFESNKLKVNDHDGNPIEIGAVVVWKVVDTAEALFEVDNYEHFLNVQTEAALRNLATSYPYDAHIDGEIALRSSSHETAERLKSEIQERLSRAGVEVIEARISHLAYAPEIASAMLQRQQASAIIAARQKIVEGAVGMVEMALAKLSHQRIVELDEDRKAAMVSNLLVVLCSDRHAQPVVNTGTLNH